jgi:HSP20 family protein
MTYENQAHSAYHGQKLGACGGYYGRHKFWQKWANWQGGHWTHGGQDYVPVNVEETESSYELHIYAPARQKQFFNLSLKDRVLTVSYKNPEGTGQERGRWSKQEYQIVDFERSFHLNPKIDDTDISAQYTEGVLQVTLPKTLAAKEPPKSIELI